METKRKSKKQTGVVLEEVHFLYLLNNSKTSFDAVIDLLTTVFSFSENEAKLTAMMIHTLGEKDIFKGKELDCKKKMLEAKLYCMQRDLEVIPMQYYSMLEFRVQSGGCL